MTPTQLQPPRSRRQAALPSSAATLSDIISLALAGTVLAYFAIELLRPVFA